MATRLNLKAAAAGKYHHNYNPITITSLDFAELAPTRVIETTLGDAFKQIKGNGVLRMTPQKFPPYGKLFIKNASFFVPESQLLMTSDAMHSKKKTYQGKAVREPGFTMVAVLSYLVSLAHPSSDWCVAVKLHDDPTQSGYADPTSAYDFIWPDNPSGSSTVTFSAYRLKWKGARLMKLLKLLGYDIPSFKLVPGDLNATKLTGTYFVSALPLLAYLKVYVDMFLSGTFYNNSPLVSLLRAVKNVEGGYWQGQLVYDPTTGEFDPFFLIPLLDNQLLTPHSGNMYTTAWNSLNSPDGVSPVNDMTTLNPTNLLSPVLSSSTGIPHLFTASADNTNIHDTNYNSIQAISEQGLNMLHSVYLFIQRNNLAGTKPAQDLFARFGIKSEDFKTNFVHKLSEGSQRIDFNAVMSNAATAGTALGDYAGFGASGVNVDYSYDASAYGYLITVHWLQIVPIITRGCHPSVLRKDGLDYYTPEYDGQASRAIPYCEISSNKSIKATVNGPKDTDVYGFTQLYQDYRELRDSVAGSFLLADSAARNYFFGRDFSVMRGSSFKPQSNAVQYYSNDDNADLTNPYNSYASQGDRFYLFIDWDISAERPIKNDEDAVDLNGKGDTVVTKNGKMLS